MQAAIEWITTLLSSHHGLTLWISAGLAFGETMAVISFFIPATTLLVAIGGLAAAGQVSLVPVWIGATGGAIAGATISWWIGHHWGDRLLRAWPFNRNPDRTARGVRAFQRWGLPAIFVGHFFGPLRAVVFIAAGASRLGFWRMQAVNIPASMLWAYTVPTFGELGGLAFHWFLAHRPF